MKITKIAILPSLFAVTFSCGKDDGSGGGSTSELNGTWSETCNVADSDSSKTTYVIASGSATVTKRSFTDKTCTTESMTMAFLTSVNGGASVATPAGAKELTTKISKMTVTLKTDELVSLYNGTMGNSAICGGGFVKDTAKDLDATACGNDPSFKSIFDEIFNIYKIDGDKLYMGACGDAGSASDCSSATKRPTVLEATYLTKS
jgi:hypothetical protein